MLEQSVDTNDVTREEPRTRTRNVVRSVSNTSPLEPAVNKGSKVYATAGQELAAYYTRMVDAEYAEHLAALQAEMRGQYEYRKGELERWRSRAIDQMCEGLER